VTGTNTDGSPVGARVSMMTTWPTAFPLHTYRTTAAVESRIRLTFAHCFVASTHHQSLAIANPPQSSRHRRTTTTREKNMYTHILIRIRVCTNDRFERDFCVFSTGKSSTTYLQKFNFRQKKKKKERSNKAESVRVRSRGKRNREWEQRYARVRWGYGYL
jgi:hypothetical protein